MRYDIIIHLSKIMRYACGVAEIEGTERRLQLIPDRIYGSDQEAMIAVMRSLLDDGIKMNRVGNITLMCDAGTFSDPNFAVSTFKSIKSRMRRTWKDDECYELKYCVEPRNTSNELQKLVRHAARSKWMKLGG